jgi:hypothetical protein
VGVDRLGDSVEDGVEDVDGGLTLGFFRGSGGAVESGKEGRPLNGLSGELNVGDGGDDTGKSMSDNGATGQRSP